MPLPLPLLLGLHGLFYGELHLYYFFLADGGTSHNKELYALYFSPNIIRVIKARRLRWGGHVARMGERIGAYRALVGKPEGRRPLGRPRRRWEDNIKMDL
jgi:hypothetical protein